MCNHYIFSTIEQRASLGSDGTCHKLAKNSSSNRLAHGAQIPPPWTRVDFLNEFWKQIEKEKSQPREKHGLDILQLKDISRFNCLLNLMLLKAAEHLKLNKDLQLWEFPKVFQKAN